MVMALTRSVCFLAKAGEVEKAKSAQAMYLTDTMVVVEEIKL
jgi:hypothetical protein